MGQAGFVTVLALLVHWAVVIGLSLRVIMRRRPIGVSLAWLALIVIVPVVGALLYLLIGENRLGERRAARARAIGRLALDRLRALADGAPVDWARLSPACEPLHRQALYAVGVPAQGGNRLELYGDAERTLRRLIADVDAARQTFDMVFYIWSAGGLADEVAEALLRAVKRGVRCRVLLDAVGSGRFLRSRQAAHLRAGGVRLVAALPVGLVRTLFRRLDLRNHRKIVVIDGEIGWTGSMNLADPRFFKRWANVGEWVDAMVRVEGPAVEALALTFLLDWKTETGEQVEELAPQGDRQKVAPRGSAVVQVVPSGPGAAPDAIHEMLITTAYAARRELVITTPYFVPDESMLMAIIAAAHRGVAVTMVVPARSDSRLVKYASAAHYDDLLAAGVQVALYRRGLLHAKTITVDNEFGLIGSVNLDMRSFWLDFEVTLFVYDPDFTARLRALQAEYLADAKVVDLAEWRRRPVTRRVVENAARLTSPLL